MVAHVVCLLVCTAMTTKTFVRVDIIDTRDYNIDTNVSLNNLAAQP